MANIVIVRVLENGPVNYVVQATGILDTSDVAVADLIDTTSAAFQRTTNPYDGLQGPPYTVGINSVEFSTESGLGFNLWWDATADVLAASFNGFGEQEFDPPLFNDAGAGKTGKLQYSVVGWSAAAVLSYACIVRCTKRFS